MPKTTTKSGAGGAIATTAVVAAIELAAEIAKAILEALANGDPSKMKTITDILGPRGQKLSCELVLEAELKKHTGKKPR